MAVGLTVLSSLGDAVLVQVGSSDRRIYLASPGDKMVVETTFEGSNFCSAVCKLVATVQVLSVVNLFVQQ